MEGLGNILQTVLAGAGAQAKPAATQTAAAPQEAVQMNLQPQQSPAAGTIATASTPPQAVIDAKAEKNRADASALAAAPKVQEQTTAATQQAEQHEPKVSDAANPLDVVLAKVMGDPQLLTAVMQLLASFGLVGDTKTDSSAKPIEASADAAKAAVSDQSAAMVQQQPVAQLMAKAEQTKAKSVAAKKPEAKKEEPGFLGKLFGGLFGGGDKKAAAAPKAKPAPVAQAPQVTTTTVATQQTEQPVLVPANASPPQKLAAVPQPAPQAAVTPAPVLAAVA